MLAQPHFIRRFLLPIVPNGFWCRLLARVIALLQAGSITWNASGSSGALEHYKPTKPAFLKSTSVPWAPLRSACRDKRHRRSNDDSRSPATPGMESSSTSTATPTAVSSRSDSSGTLVGSWTYQAQGFSRALTPPAEPTSAALGAAESSDRGRSASLNQTQTQNYTSSGNVVGDSPKHEVTESQRSLYRIFSALRGLVARPDPLVATSTTSSSTSLTSISTLSDPGRQRQHKPSATQSLANTGADDGVHPSIEVSLSELHVHWAERAGFTVRLHLNIAHAERVPPGTQALDIVVPISLSNDAGSGQVNAGVEITQRLLSQVIDSVDLIIDEWFRHILNPTGLNDIL